MMPDNNHRQRRICITFLFLFVGLLCLPGRLAAQQPQLANQGGNNPPKAIPGPNQKIGVHPNVVAVTTLDGSQSSDPDFDFITFQWKDQGGNVLSTNTTVQVALANPGLYTYVLTVCDTSNACNSKITQIAVVLDVNPPVVDAPDLTIGLSGNGGARGSDSGTNAQKLSAFLKGTGSSAVDDVDPQPKFIEVHANGVVADDNTFFPEGDTPVVVYFSDQAGNVGSSTATVHVVDRQDSDIFVQNGVGNCFGTSCNDALSRIRGSSLQQICSLAGGTAPSRGLIVDSSGRLVGLRFPASIAGSVGLEMVRCMAKGAPPEPFAWVPNYSPAPAGYSEPFPSIHADEGGGLHLARLRTVVIDDNQNHGNPFVINEDAYVLSVVSNSAQITKMYHVKQDFWEDGPQLGPSLGGGIMGNNPVSMYFHNGATYAAGQWCLDRTKVPLSLHASGTLGGVNFDLQLGLFGSSGEICSWLLDDSNGPHTTACNGSVIPGDGSGFSVMSDFYAVLFDDFGSNGLTLISGSVAPGVLTRFSELPFDDPGNPGNFFPNPFNSCASTGKVAYTSMPTPSGSGSWGPRFVASGPSGLIGTSPFSLGGVVFSMAPGNSAQIATGVPGVGGVAVWPPNVSAGATLSVLIRIDSPVDVLVTDPNGKKLGMQFGVPVNDFANDGFDSGAGSHPRFYAINNPVPGDFTVQSVGTGTGPYTVHVYSVDTSKPFGQHIFSSGNASPGVLSNQNFTLGAVGGVSFTNHAPNANAGPDQTVNAASNGSATVNLDGSASSDPDGDSLTFTWAGPFGLASGSQPQVTLPIGVSVLTLTVDDGKGGSASSSVTITVNPPADTTPPVLSLPANITVQATSSSGAVVNFTASATDAVDGSVPVTCVPPSGSTFAVGTTTVNCSATDLSHNTASGSFTVTVNPLPASGTPRITVTLAGQLRTNDSMYVDLLLTNAGTSDTTDVRIVSLQFTTLSGSGSASLNTRRTTLPVVAGNIAAGSSKTVRLYLIAPSGVTKFSLTATGKFRDANGAAQNFSSTLSITP